MEVCSVLRCVCEKRIHSSIAKDLKFDWSVQVTWKQRAYSLVQQHKSWQILQLLSFLITVGAGGLFSGNRLFIILSHYLQLLAEVLQNGVLKNLSQFTGKHLFRSFFLISQYFLIRVFDIDAFLWILRNCQENHFYRPPWDSCFCVFEHL